MRLEYPASSLFGVYGILFVHKIGDMALVFVRFLQNERDECGEFVDSRHSKDD